MYRNKLIRLLQTFSRKEMTRLKEFVESPYFNKHEDVRRLVGHLSDLFPDFNEDNCDRKTLFRFLFPGQPHNQNKLAVIFTYTQRLAEQFLVHEWREGDAIGRQLFLLRHLRHREHYSLYEKELRRMHRQVKGIPVGDPHYFYWQYRYAEEADAYFDQIERRQKDWSIQKKHNNLDFFYLAEKLRDACEMTVRSKILKVRYESRMLESILTEVDRNHNHYGNAPAILVYAQLYRMLNRPERDYYFEALKTLQQFEQFFPVSERKSIYNHFQNYCIEQINKGQGRFLEEIFKLYKVQLDQGLLLEEGYLSEWHFKNIVTTGIRLRALDWVRDFIKSYREKLRPEAQENAYRFNLASYFYAAGKYERVLELLIRVEYSDLRYNLGAKALLLRTYYDLEEYEALFSLTESFRQYLLRNKLLADGRRQGYNNLFRFARRAAHLRSNLGYFDGQRCGRELKKLQEDIEKADAIFNKGWLEEKVSELEAEMKTTY